MWDKIDFVFKKKIGKDTKYDKLNQQIRLSTQQQQVYDYVLNNCNEFMKTYNEIFDYTSNFLPTLSLDEYGINRKKEEIDRLKRSFKLILDNKKAQEIQNQIILKNKELYEIEKKACENYIERVINGKVENKQIFMMYKKMLSLLEIIINNNNIICKYNDNFVKISKILLNSNCNVTYDMLTVVYEYISYLYSLAVKSSLNSSYEIKDIENSYLYNKLKKYEDIWNKKR